MKPVILRHFALVAGLHSGHKRCRGQQQSESEKCKHLFFHKFSVSKKNVSNLNSSSCLCQRRLAADLIIAAKEFSRSDCAVEPAVFGR
jgi:hypothetical protein